MAKFSLPKVAAAGAVRSKRSATSYIKQHVRDRLTSNFGIVGAYAADKAGLQTHHRGGDTNYAKTFKRKNVKIKATDPAGAITESAEQLGGGLTVLEQAISQGGDSISAELTRFSEEVTAKLEAMSNALEAMAYEKAGKGAASMAGPAAAEMKKEAADKGGGWWDTAKGIVAGALGGAFLGRLGRIAALLGRGAPVVGIVAAIAMLAKQKADFERDNPEEAQKLRDRWRGGHLLDPSYSGTAEEVKKQGPLERKKFLSTAEIATELKKRGKSINDLDPSKREGNVVYLKDGTRIDLGSQTHSSADQVEESNATALPEVVVSPDEQTFEADRIEIEGTKEIYFEEENGVDSNPPVQGDDSIPRGTTQGAANRNGQATNMRGIGNPQMGVKDPSRLHATSGGWTSHAFTDNPSNVTKYGVSQLQGKVYMSNEPGAKTIDESTEKMEKESTLGVMYKDTVVLRNSTGDRRNPLIGQTFDHEATHMGAMSYYKSSPETKKMFPEVRKHQDFEELRERIHDQKNFSEALARDPTNKTLLNRMDQTKSFIKSISEQIAKTEGGDANPQHFINRAAQYNDHLNQSIGELPGFKKSPYGFNGQTGEANPKPNPAQLMDTPEFSHQTSNGYRDPATGLRDPSRGILQQQDATRELGIQGGAGVQGLLPPTTDEQRRFDAMPGSFASKNDYSVPTAPPPSRGIGSDYARDSNTAAQTEATQRQEENREREREDQPSFTDMAGTGYNY